jgi:hypothetical protein
MRPGKLVQVTFVFAVVSAALFMKAVTAQSAERTT